MVFLVVEGIRLTPKRIDSMERSNGRDILRNAEAIHGEFHVGAISLPHRDLNRFKSEILLN